MTNLPTWVKAIPESQAHGSGTLQKRLWRVTSDYVRIRDWYEWSGKCVATGKYIGHWKLGDAGHFKSWSKCNGMSKFDLRNIHLQGKQSNGFGDKDDWDFFEHNMKARGYFPEEFELSNRKAINSKIKDWEVIDQMRWIISMMKDLPEQPDYYDRVMSLFAKLQ